MAEKVRVFADHKLIVFANPDKKYRERWSDDRHPLNFPHPSRIIVFGAPDSGKTNFIKNIIAQAQISRRPYMRIIVYKQSRHGNEWPEDSYDVMYKLPTERDFKGEEKKTLVILEDLPPYKDMSKDETAQVNRLFAFLSTHANVTVILITHEWQSIPPAIRDKADVFIMWRNSNAVSMRALETRLGMHKGDIAEIFENCEFGTHDCLVIDRKPAGPSGHHPGYLRKNGTTPIDPVG